MFAVLYKLGWFFKQYWRRYTIAVVILALVGILEVIPPKLIGVTIDKIHLGTLDWPELRQTLFTYGLLTIVIYFITYVWMYLLFGGSFLLERTLRSRIMRHLLRMTPTFFERNRTGDLMARATNDLWAVSNTTGFGILTMVDSSIFLLTILCTMGFMISWKLTLAALIPLPIIAIVISIFGKIIHQRFTISQDAFGDMNDQVLETIAGVRVIRAYVQERADEQKFLDLTNDVYRKNMAVTRIDALFEPAVKICVGLSYLIGIGYGAYMVFQQQITLGELVSFNVYLGMMIWPMFAIGELINIMQRGNASLDRVNETLSYKEDVSNASQPVTNVKPDSIVFSGYGFRYPSSGADNLKDVHVTLKRGQTLGIVGRTGSGKTTFIKQLLREYPIGRGKLSIAGVPLEQIDVDLLHSWMGYVPQDQMLFSRTVRENILFGFGNGTERDVQQALELASFHKDIHVLADGLETMVGEKGVALSGGQKQRVSIARAVIADPEILLLDDALSAVDAKTEARIIGNIRAARAGKTTLITTHRLSAVQHADWIIVLDNGEIVEQGTHEQLLAVGGWYLEQFERQQIEADLTEAG